MKDESIGVKCGHFKLTDLTVYLLVYWRASSPSQTAPCYGKAPYHIPQASICVQRTCQSSVNEYCDVGTITIWCDLLSFIFYVLVDDGAILDVQFMDFSFPPPDSFDCIMFEKNIL